MSLTFRFAAKKYQQQVGLKILPVFFAFVYSTMVHASEGAKSKDERGLLPELQIKEGQTEESNDLKSVGSEILISRAEKKAIEALQNLLKKKAGTPEEPDLLYRLAELYMRRSKSGRFFDLRINQKTSTLTSFPIANEKGSDSIRKAIEIYNKIENKFKKYPDLDSVLFNNAFAHQQLKLERVSESLYKKMIDDFPKSNMRPDASLALAELFYDQQRFKESLAYFKNLEEFPTHKIYSYAMYKMAWAYYNLKDSEAAVKKLTDVIKLNSPTSKDQTQIQNQVRSYNLRKEALRDMTIFIGEVMSPKDLYSFFSKLCTEEELGQSMLDLAKLYDSHSRFKEIPIFINEFNSKHPAHPLVVQTHLILVNSYETLKQREQVLESLKAGSELCQRNSSWAKSQTPENFKESCEKNFRQESLEISKKWWDIWLKNKSHQEFSSLTERALRLILNADNIDDPDFKTRYALAELLFQKEKMNEASIEYFKVAQILDKKINQKKTDKNSAKNPEDAELKTLWHDSSYASLFSQEKNIEALKSQKQKTETAEALRKTGVQYYMLHFPEGEHITPVQMKWALIQYDENKWDDAIKTLTPLTLQKNNRDIKIKAEDLILDILNLKKDYATLKNLSKSYAEQTSDKDRKNNLQKINEQAHYSEVQALTLGPDKKSAAEALMQFSKDHKSSSLSKEAQWQALSLYITQGQLSQIAALSESFAQLNPQDSRAKDAIKESIRTSIELGRHEHAALLIQKLIDLEPNSSDKGKLQEQAAQLYFLDGHKKEARLIWSQLMNQKNEAQREKMRTLILSSFAESEKSGTEYQKFMDDLVQKSVEPYATEYYLNKAQKLFLSNKKTEAFDLSKKIMSRDVSGELRAPARLIQAAILEDEFKSQSVKSSSVEKFALVIAMKSEKMEKALSSYLSVMKMSSAPDLQMKTLQGLDRIYENYISQLSDIKPPPSMSEADFKALSQEVSALLAAIKEKQAENKKQLLALQESIKNTPRHSADNFDWTQLAGSATVQPPVKYFKPELLEVFISDSLPKVDYADTRAIETWIESPQTQSLGYFHLSIAAEKKGLLDKALWAIEKSLSNQKEKNVLTENEIYQQLRLKIKKNGWSLVQSELDQTFDLKISSTQIETLKSFQYFKMSQYGKTQKILSQVPLESLYTMNGFIIYIESLCQTGDIDKAIRVLRSSPYKKNVEALIQMGRIYEQFKPSVQDALQAYSEALKAAPEEAQRLWLERKLEYLKNLGQVGTRM